MSGSPGFRIASNWNRPDPATVIAFAEVPSPNVGDAMNRLGVVDPHIQAVWPGARCVGSALPVWVRAGDNLMIHKAIDMAEPGDVIVVNGQGDLTRALFGELMAQSAAALGVGGLVFDGVVRDVASLAELRLPVFARGVSPAGPFKQGPGEIGRPVAIGGVVCAPGDLVVADADGVVIVPRQDADVVLAEAQAIQEREAKRIQEIRGGSPRRAGIDEELIRRGVIGEAS